MDKFTVVVLPRDREEGRKTRDIVISVVKSCWKAINEWTTAFNSGLQSLKSVVSVLVSMKSEDELPSQVHSNCHNLTLSVEAMEKIVRSLKGLSEQLEKITEIEENTNPGITSTPLFATIPLKRYCEVLRCLWKSYEEETAIKRDACKPLPRTFDAETLNTCITLWTNHLYLLKPHLYHIKILLYDAQLL